MDLDFSGIEFDGKDDDLALRADRDGVEEKVTLFLIARLKAHGSSWGANRVEFCETSEGKEVDSLVELKIDQAIELMTDLWQCGIRPEGVDLSDTRELKAIKQHLEDSRMFAIALWNRLNGQGSTIGPVTARPQRPIKLPDKLPGDPDKNPDIVSGNELPTPKGPKV